MTCTTAHDNAGSLTHWMRPGIKPVSSRTLCQVLNQMSHNGNSHAYFIFILSIILITVVRAQWALMINKKVVLKKKSCLISSAGMFHLRQNALTDDAMQSRVNGSSLEKWRWYPLRWPRGQENRMRRDVVHLALYTDCQECHQAEGAWCGTNWHIPGRHCPLSVRMSVMWMPLSRSSLNIVSST